MRAPHVAAWEHFSHEADIGIRGIGRTPEEAFEQAGLAVTAVICDIADVRETNVVQTACNAADLEMLFVEWIDAIVYEMTTRRMLFHRYRVHIDDGRLSATLRGEPIEPARHEPAVEIKGATLTGLRVTKDADGLWRAQCVVDV